MEAQRLPLNQMRASDTERDLTVDRLAVAFSEGRLDHEEYERRVGAALTSVLVGELRTLTADLPGPESPIPLPRPHLERSTAPEPRVAPVPWEEWGDEWRWWLGVAGVLTGVWAVASLLGGELVPYWPLVPLGIWAAVLLASAIWPSEENPP
ncbi:DUF1707 SHOCT-like domain-containing protein [Nocardiopsis metallicus]|uniref:DUF1707 domain-containing protein n=1 Tax=Nocardiopsis metallicus TaxID=179819 RepID=A0A840W7L4_9ACTN|nr:DUF1707 domain-containing protein [Nocardiopsis metallicus]MBB5492032.1 hypothetical protein [Nocardiopsis metallicus]